MGSLDPGRQTADAIARVTFWCNRGCTNSLYEFMDSSIAIRQYHRMGLSDSGRKTANVITRPTCWHNRGCTHGLCGFMASSIAIQ